MRKKEFKKLLRIETTTSYDAIDTSNVFLKPDPVLKSLNEKQNVYPEYKRPHIKDMRVFQ